MKEDSAYKYQQMAYINIDSLYTSRQDLVKEFQRLSLNEQIHSHQLEKEKIQTAANTKTYAMLTGLIVVLFIAFILYRNNTQKQKANKVLQATLSDLKSTQAQLIQSEKMASLGELTAGIAHEIQNPLNFVNNFSEVNNELIDELEGERSKVKPERNEELENEILSDLKQNLKKINHHGKRADAIVKSMLQHSRAGTEQKEPTDINVLCDEYLRLSYHGLRAKNKSFNADFKTDFDESIGKINVVPQNIGRVLLNLFNNAFYATNQKQKDLTGFSNLSGQHYVPTVTVVTKKINNKIEITISDNGNGIPSLIKDKIFQPFFTTKPTGQGTGLGLSLAYDIITKEHNGTIKVESKEGEGSTFIIQLPVV
jgi:signal transduction histidine kinase